MKEDEGEKRERRRRCYKETWMNCPTSISLFSPMQHPQIQVQAERSSLSPALLYSPYVGKFLLSSFREGVSPRGRDHDRFEYHQRGSDQ